MHATQQWGTYVEAKTPVLVRAWVRGFLVDAVVQGWRGDRVSITWKGERGTHLGWVLAADVERVTTSTAQHTPIRPLPRTQPPGAGSAT